MAVAARGPSCFDRSVMVRYERTGPREAARVSSRLRSEEHTSELQSQSNLVCRLLLEKKKKPYDNAKRNSANSMRPVRRTSTHSHRPEMPTRHSLTRVASASHSSRRPGYTCTRPSRAI